MPAIDTFGISFKVHFKDFGFDRRAREWRRPPLFVAIVEYDLATRFGEREAFPRHETEIF
jgi:hypothetical protein